MDAFEELSRDFPPELFIRLAAQAGVRHSIDNPDAYVDSNLIGTFSVLELARRYPVKTLVAASSSSIYGANTKMPFREADRTASPVSLYAATKGAGELMGHAYAHLYRIPTTFFHFFTVYDPWGRPDMAYFKFTKAILEGTPIDVYNHGRSLRDFTYVGDLVEAVLRLSDLVPGDVPLADGDSLSSVAPCRVVKIGQAQPASLTSFIKAIELACGRSAEKRNLPAQPGDVDATHASTDILRQLIDYVPSTPLEDGIQSFVDWYIAFYHQTNTTCDVRQI